MATFPDLPLVLVSAYPNVAPAQRTTLHDVLQKLQASGNVDVVLVDLYCST